MSQSYFEIKRRILQEQEGLLLRDYLLRIERISRRALKAIKFGTGDLLVNGEHKTVRYVLHEGDQLIIRFPPEAPSHSLQAEPMSLNIVFEDEHLIVINKPAGLPVIPSQRYPHGTLANGVLYYFQSLGLSYTVHTVTRLDRDTSGLLLIAKHRHAHDLFVRQQKNRLLERRYLAIVHGVIHPLQGVIDAPIGRRPDSMIERCVTPQGKTALTRYQVLKYNECQSLVKIKLETGRTHQIRVHFAHIGYPLLGDDLYGGSRDMISRQALHSYELHFVHPFTNKTMAFQAPCYEDMAYVVKNMG